MGTGYGGVIMGRLCGGCDYGAVGVWLWGGAFGAAEVSRWCFAVVLGRLACRDRVVVGYILHGVSGLSI